MNVNITHNITFIKDNVNNYRNKLFKFIYSKNKLFFDIIIEFNNSFFNY